MMKLSDREIQVIQAIIRHDGDLKAAADDPAICLTLNTMKQHASRIRRRMGIDVKKQKCRTTVAAIVIRALKAGIVKIEELR